MVHRQSPADTQEVGRATESCRAFGGRRQAGGARSPQSAGRCWLLRSDHRSGPNQDGMRHVENGFVLSATDLSNFLSCRHRTALEMSAAKGKRKKPFFE